MLERATTTLAMAADIARAQRMLVDASPVELFKARKNEFERRGLERAGRDTNLLQQLYSQGALKLVGRGLFQGLQPHLDHGLVGIARCGHDQPSSELHRAWRHIYGDVAHLRKVCFKRCAHRVNVWTDGPIGRGFYGQA